MHFLDRLIALESVVELDIADFIFFFIKDEISKSFGKTSSANSLVRTKAHQSTQQEEEVLGITGSKPGYHPDHLIVQWLSASQVSVHPFQPRFASKPSSIY